MTQKLSMDKDNIKEGKIRQVFRDQGFGDMLLDDHTLLKSRQSLIPDSEILKTEIWLFGYGSLIWNPFVDPIEKRVVKVHGLHRKFCLKTEIGRGSKKNPGLVLGLTNGGSASGIALKIDSKSALIELDLIWKREMITGAYEPKLIKGYTDKGKVEMIAFIINKMHSNYISSISEAETALMISKAHGFLGTSIEYLEKTCESLNSLGLKDNYLNRLYERIDKKNYL